MSDETTKDTAETTPEKTAEATPEKTAEATPEESTEASAQPTKTGVQEDRYWEGEGWTARIFKNEDDDGWAVSMTRDGEPEPTIVVPWTMGRDKKNPKPLDKGGFTVLLKNATETRTRTEQQRRARLHQSIEVTFNDERVRVELDIVEDEDDPHAWLSAHSASGEQLARQRVEANFKLSGSSASKWLSSQA